MMKLGRCLLLALAGLISEVTVANADGPVPQEEASKIARCPAGTSSVVDGDVLKCKAEFRCSAGYTATPTANGLICFKRQNAIAAADCNNCNVGAHVQVGRPGRDTCSLFNSNEPNKLRCCGGATRWKDKDGLVDVCGFFSKPQKAEQ
jgi:hypothetical protein